MPGTVKIQKELFQNLLDGDFDYDKSIALLPNSLFLIQLDWIKNTVVDKNKNANPEDLDLIHIVDHEDEVLEILNKFYNKYNLSPNF